MTATARAALMSIWILVVGIAAVHLEVENTRSGVRIRDLLLEKEARLERIRRLEMRYNRMVSPDLLERRLPDDFREVAGDPDAGESAKQKRKGRQ